MTLEKDLIITLNNKNYYVISTTVYENTQYAYLVNISEEDDYIYVKVLKAESSVEILTAPELINVIAPMLLKNVD